MPEKFKSIITLLLVLSSVTCGNSSAQEVPNVDSLIDRGIELRDENRIDEALQLWMKAKAMYDSTAFDRSDPRIGILYISTVSANRIKERYKRASAVYLWGLSNPDDSRFEKMLKDEAERLDPLIAGETRDRWDSYLRNRRYQAFGSSVIQFWKVMDPTLETDYNERLMEHWERIAYAKENFKRAGNTVYGTDDRAQTYIKLGKPDHIENGRLNFNTRDVRNWIYESFQFQEQHFGQSVFQTGTFKNLSNREKARRLTKNVRFQHGYPYYEIWIYRDLIPDRRENLIFIFGNEGNTGAFRQRTSLEEMIPSSAFRQNKNRNLAVPPAFYLQLQFYKQLRYVDPYFMEAFRNLETKLYSADMLKYWTPKYTKTIHKNRLVSRRMQAPRNRTNLLSEIPSIELEVFQFRLLDDENRPRLATYMESKPHWIYYLDQIRENTFEASNYRLYHTFRVIKEEDEIVESRQFLSAIRPGKGSVTEMDPSVSFAEIGNIGKEARQIFTVELRNKERSSQRLGDNVFSENIRAIGIRNLEQVEPLETDPYVLEMGDLVTGYTDLSYHYGPFDFRVVRDGRLPPDKNLMVHFEVYHLDTGAEGRSNFQVTYRVKPKTGFIKGLFEKEKEVKLTLNFESTDTNYRDNLEIDTSPFEAGTYELELTATEPATGRSVSRKVSFEITQPDRQANSRSN